MDVIGTRRLIVKKQTEVGYTIHGAEFIVERDGRHSLIFLAITMARKCEFCMSSILDIVKTAFTSIEDDF
jgi:hypothetical protein